jgi:hypothetical protein
MTRADELTEDELMARLVTEMREQRVPMELVLRAISVIHFAGLLQLAGRHPSLSDHNRDHIERFMVLARAYFADCPAALEVLRRGDDRQDPTGENR